MCIYNLSIHIAKCFICLFVMGVGLFAQSYQSSFEDQYFDRGVSPAQIIDLTSIDISTGTLGLSIPLGPTIGGGALKYSPLWYSDVSPRLRPIGLNSYSFAKPRESRNGGLNFGKLVREYGINRNMNFNLPDGSNGSFYLSSATAPPKGPIPGISVAEMNELIAAFGYQDTTVDINEFHPTVTTTSGLIFAVKGPTSADSRIILSRPLLNVARRLFMIQNSVLYEFSYDGFHAEGVKGDPGAGYDVEYVNYFLTKMSDKFSRCIYFSKTDSSIDGGSKKERHAKYYYNGNFVCGFCWEGITPVPVVGQGAGVVDIYYDDSSSSVRKHLMQMGVSGDWDESFYSIKYLTRNENISIQWGDGPSVLGNNSKVIKSINYSTRKVEFEYEPYRYRSNRKTNIFNGYSGSPDYYVIGVKSRNETDLSSGVKREVSYLRTTPVPKPSTEAEWVSTDFRVIIGQCDGTYERYNFVEPLPSGSGGVDFSLSDQMRTLAHLKHQVREIRYYENKSLLDSDDPYKVVSYDKWDVRGVGNPDGLLSFTPFPRPTRVRTWDRDAKFTEIRELAKWNRLDFGWMRQIRVFFPSETGAGIATQYLSESYSGTEPQYDNIVIDRTVQMTLGSIPSKWMWGLLNKEIRAGVAPKTYKYNPSGLLEQERWNEGGDTQIDLNFEYTSSDIPTMITKKSLPNLFGSGDNGAKYELDEFGLVNKISQIKTGPNLTWPWCVQATNDQLGRLTSKTDENGIQTRFEWDEAGRLVAIVPPGDEIATNIIYNDSDHQGATVLRGAQRTEYRYDGFGQLVLVRRWDGASRSSHQVFSYDLSGRKIFESIWIPGNGSDADGLSTNLLQGARYTYDARGRLVDKVDPNGLQSRINYSGLMRTVTVAPGTSVAATTIFTSDILGRLSSVTDAKQHVTTYTYDPADRIVEVRQYTTSIPNGDGSYRGTGPYQSRTWEYNGLGWTKGLNQPETGNTTNSDFDINGNPWTTNYNGRIVQGTFDALGRIRSLTANDGSVSQSFLYDQDEPGHGLSNGKLIKATQGTVERSLVYGGVNGRLSKFDYTIDGRAFPQAMTYDSFGQLITRTYPDSKIQFTTFSGATGLPSATRFDGAGIANFGYDPVSWNLTTLAYLGAANGSSSTFTYRADQVGLASLTHSIPGELFSKAWSYGYDGAGRLISDGEDHFSYDDLGRLTVAFARDPFDTAAGNSNRGLMQTFGYDAFGNRISASTQSLNAWTANAMPLATMSPSSLLRAGLNEVTANVTFSASDAAFLKNRMPETTTTGAHYDAQGNLDRVYTTPGDTTTQVSMTHDALGRVTAVTSKAGSEQYLYDDEGLRVRVWDGTRFRYNIYNEARQLVSQFEETLQGGEVSAMATQSKARGAFAQSANGARLRIAPQAKSHQERGSFITSERRRTTDNATRAVTAAKAPASGTDAKMVIYLPPIDGDPPTERDLCGAYIDNPSTNATVTVGQAVLFSGSTDFGTSATWTFGNGGTASGFNTSYAYTAVGTYTVRLRVTGPAATTMPSLASRVITVVPPAASIGSFGASTSTIPFGGSTTLSWSSSNATAVTLNGSAVPLSGSQVVTPGTTTTYTLLASNGGASVNQQVVVTVVQPPAISGFSASPANIYQGDSSTLCWTVSGATSLSIDQGIGAVTGNSRVVNPSASSTYVLTATNSLNGVSVARTASTSISVGARPTVPNITSFSADSSTIGVGSGTTLRWSVGNAVGGTNVTLTAVGAVPSVSTIWITPSTTTTYTLTATNSLDTSKTVSANVTVTVIQKPVIQHFTGSPSNVFAGGTATLSWSITNDPTSVSINNGGGSNLAPSGSASVVLNEGTTYILTASNLGGTTTSQVSVTVSAKPSITSFTATPEIITKGRSATLAWNVQGASSYTINGATVNGTSLVVAPSDTTFYTLRAINGSGYTEQSIAVTVKDTGTLVWKKDIIYVGTKEVAEVSPTGTSITMTDHLGSPRFIWDGTTLTKQKFLPFGEQLTDPTSMGKVAKGFTNHEQTDASGLIYMQARFYLPMWGRFASPDPGRDQHFEETQSWNIYSYVRNNPIMNIDPNGEELVAIRLANSTNVSVNSQTRGRVIVIDRSMVPRVSALITRSEMSGVKWTITSSFRTNEEQSGLNSSNAVTPAKAGRSPHNAGLGLDGVHGGKKSLPDPVVDHAEDLGLRWGGNFKRADDVHVDGVESNAQRSNLTTENQQQWRTGTIQGMVLDARTGNLTPANISNSEMRRKTGQTSVGQSAPAAKPSSPSLFRRIIDWINR